MYGPNMLQTLLQLTQQMYHALCLQHEQLQRMEAELHAIREQVAKQESLPSTHVDKIEYNFEQLKVDTLDGTLVIGISPNESGNVVQWAAQHQSGEDAVIGTASAQTSEDEGTESNIHDRMEAYIRDSVPEMLAQVSEQAGIALSEDDKQAVVEDMVRQMDGRIALYMQNIGNQGGISADSTADELVQALQNDIHAAIHTYIEHFREERGRDG